MVRVKLEPSTQGYQGASNPLLNTNPYILTSKTLNPGPSNLGPNSENIKPYSQKPKPPNTELQYPAAAGEENIRTSPLSTPYLNSDI